MSETLVVNEIYLSLQGESTFAGLPCIFIRLTACDLRCSYCDTAYAFSHGSKMTLREVRDKVNALAVPFARENEPQQAIQKPAAANPAGVPALPRLPLVELTGGEPLLQKNSLGLMKALCDDGFVVLLETSGAHDISGVDARVRRIMDLKCPSSGETGRNLWENIQRLRPSDEIKFVIGTRKDYEWAKQQISKHGLARMCPLLISWAHPLGPAQRHSSLKSLPPGQTPITRQQLAEQIIADGLAVRFQVQMHKVIWPPEQRGV